MNLKINSESYVFPPAHEDDAGYDILAASEPVIIGNRPIGGPYYSTIDYIEYDTNLIIEPDSNFHTYVLPRSSISKTNLVLANSVGLIDNGYRGTVKLRFKYIAQPKDWRIVNGDELLIELDFDKIYGLGDKIGQLVFAETIKASFLKVDSFVNTSRNEGGFGSTGS
jgi:dUTP pyrophosphatase